MRDNPKQAVRQRGQIKDKGNGVFDLVVYLGEDEATGKRKYKSHRFRGSRKAAAKELNRLQGEVDDGDYIEPSKETLGAYLAGWLDGYRLVVTAKTHENAAYAVRYVMPHLGRRPLDTLTPTHLRALYAAGDGRGADRHRIAEGLFQGGLMAPVARLWGRKGVGRPECRPTPFGVRNRPRSRSVSVLPVEPQGPELDMEGGACYDQPRRGRAAISEGATAISYDQSEFTKEVIVEAVTAYAAARYPGEYEVDSRWVEIFVASKFYLNIQHQGVRKRLESSHEYLSDERSREEITLHAEEAVARLRQPQVMVVRVFNSGIHALDEQEREVVPPTREPDGEQAELIPAAVPISSDCPSRDRASDRQTESSPLAQEDAAGKPLRPWVRRIKTLIFVLVGSLLCLFAEDINGRLTAHQGNLSRWGIYLLPLLRLIGALSVAGPAIAWIKTESFKDELRLLLYTLVIVFTLGVSKVIHKDTLSDLSSLIEVGALAAMIVFLMWKTREKT